MNLGAASTSVAASPMTVADVVADASICGDAAVHCALGSHKIRWSHMTTFFGMRKLGGADDWKGIAGEDKWKATRSAYELAYAWHGAGKRGIPVGIAGALDDSGIPELSRLKLEIGFVEKPTFLDTPIGPSMTDIMGY